MITVEMFSNVLLMVLAFAFMELAIGLALMLWARDLERRLDALERRQP
jgi:hypothetical protein